MEAEHPIPQEVSKYQFKLVGDMTLQQFFQVAGGALVSLVIYSSSMAGYVKWPLIIISFLSGIALAFFPIEDRPLTTWIILFMKAIYSPTIYVWNKNAVRHDFFQPENDQFNPNTQTLQSTAPVATQGQTAPASQQPAPNTQPVTQPSEQDKLEAKEQEFLNKVQEQFTTSKVQPVIKTAPVSAGQQPNPQNANLKTNIPIPEKQNPSIQPHSKEQSQSTSGDVFSSKSNVGGQISPSATQNVKQAQQATFSPEAAPPSPPTRPNIIVGQTLDITGKIIDGAILEIKDSNGRSVRALRTNRLGHFMIVTPLSDGKYQIVSEKEGYDFEPVSLELNNRVIPPVAITGKLISGGNLSA